MPTVAGLDGSSDTRVVLKSKSRWELDGAVLRLYGIERRDELGSKTVAELLLVCFRKRET